MTRRITAVKAAVVVEIDGPMTKKLRTDKSDSNPNFQQRTSECHEDAFGVSRILPQVTATRVTRSGLAGSSLDLGARERALVKKEQEFKRKSEALDQQLSMASKKEQKASDMIAKYEMKAAEATLELLDEHFTCSL